MKNYTITVNGVAYDVMVEENTASASRESVFAAPRTAPKAAPQTAAYAPPKAAPVKAPQPVPVPQAAPAPTPAPAPKAAPAAGAGAIKIDASIPGKVVKIEAQVGQAVKAGENILILEAMKMEIPVVAPQAGTVASIVVRAGDTVESGDSLATMN